jgi:hypothetical protein
MSAILAREATIGRSDPRLLQAKIPRSYLKNSKSKKKGWGCDSSGVAQECLPSKWEALGSTWEKKRERLFQDAKPIKIGTPMTLAKTSCIDFCFLLFPSACYWLILLISWFLKVEAYITNLRPFFSNTIISVVNFPVSTAFSAAHNLNKIFHILSVQVFSKNSTWDSLTFLCTYCFGGTGVWISGLGACKAGTLWLEPHLQTILLWLFLEMGFLELFVEAGLKLRSFWFQPP